jgi:phage recombination protein Bet
MAGNNRNQEKEAAQAARALVVQPPRLPYPSEAAAPEGISQGQWKALVDAVFPSAKTVDGVMLAVAYCKSRNLDVFKRAVHVVPMYNAALGYEVETVWPGINELRTTAARTGTYAGIDDCVFGNTISRGFEVSEQREKWNPNTRQREAYPATASCPKFDWPEWAQVTVYRIVAGQRVPFVGPKVRFMEMFSGEKGLRVPNAKWRASPWQMLEKCAEAAALRRAFPEELANDYTADEMEGKSIDIASTGRAGKEAVEEVTGEVVNDERPTRESTKKHHPDAVRLGISQEHWDELDIVQARIDRTTNPADLREGCKAELRAFMELERPDPVLKELELRFNTAIGRLEGTDQQSELPLAGDAGTTTDKDPPAKEEDHESGTD